MWKKKKAELVAARIRTETMSDEEMSSTDEVPGQTSHDLPSSSSATSVPSPVDDNQSEPIGSVHDTTLESVGITVSRSSNTHINVVAVSPNISPIPLRMLPPATTPPQWQSQTSIWCNDCYRRVFWVLTYPVILVLSIIGVIVVLIFCVFPTLLFMGLVICAYYCMSSEPVPLSVLLRELFAGEDPNRRTNPSFPNGTGNGIVDPEKARADRMLYRTQLIVRRLLKVEKVPLSCSRAHPLAPRGSSGSDENNSKGDIKVIDHRSNTPKPKIGADSDDKSIDDELKSWIDKVHIRKYNAPIEIWTDHRILHFSAPLEAPIEDSNGDEGGRKKQLKLANETRSLSGGDIEAPFVAHYQRSSEIELSSGHLRESSPPMTPGNLFSSEHDRTPSERNIHLDDYSGSCQSDSHVCRSTDKPTGTILPLGENSDAGSITDQIDATSEKSESTNTPPISSPQKDYFGIEDDERDPGTSCDICILEFEVGDEIAWSPNLQCSHAFRKDCILDW